MHHYVVAAIENIKHKSQGEVTAHPYSVTINFHPDRFTPDGEPLLQAIAQQGNIKSQFETKTSNGGLTAFKGGERWLWENRVFDGAYDEASDALRPKYGALNFRLYETGASPRFGSAYFVLKAETLNRTTFCYPDSFFEPEDFAVSEQIGLLISKATEDNQDRLDDYIEAHIHGVLSIEQDIECIVLDPVYRNTPVEEQALALGIPVRWHNGYELSIEEMSRYPNYRGPQYIDLAREIARNGKINPKLLGLAVTEQGYDEQDIKKVWHYLARFGYRA
ncbi:DUF3626 domain-containing protein [Vibrio ulleungensis]|uniref:DUF3626 domain-containing protein n=1 Tax=Vibrio ulleungensis TaxID=2807619 RepID=A0ABS2HGH1_9VIBR|nr:DUF3626 domain-containing protein [Vibrio ulleungensis]MBM7035243.1 DUF3626 domain-containing protein [Vibrio ulleungensis]